MLDTQSNSEQLSKTVNSGVATQAGSYRLNHPKNYIGIPLAIAADGPTEPLIQSNVAMPGGAQLGAYALGYVTNDSTLTPLGKQLVEEICSTYETPDTALSLIGDLHGKTGRFSNREPAMAEAARNALVAHPPAQQIISTLQNHTGSLSLPELAVELYQQDRNLCESFLLQDEAELSLAIEDSLDDVDSEIPEQLLSSDAYRANTTYQFKSVLCHLGILTTPGSDTSSLNPETDRWELTPEFEGVDN